MALKKVTDVIEHPTSKQVDFAQAISKELSIDLPTSYTKAAYQKFISDNISSYNTIKNINKIDDEDAYAYGWIGIGCEHFDIEDD